ncbi:hypothetical protein R1538_34765 [Rhizobium leguminosarum]|uniref:hypothetical protein n=1 Tax=Rhizobium leguminosarum TaxID=384 RepID=UPI00293DD0CC|nr:hypothetical protein [Rhizobium leguminosarum]MDV4166215.1 hypothetical protein [Rhizobium leguminosarum]
MSEWIEWAGGECPVPLTALVDVRYADGHEEFFVEAELLARDCHGEPDDWWKHEGHPTENIIAYRVINPHASESSQEGS